MGHAPRPVVEVPGQEDGHVITLRRAMVEIGVSGLPFNRFGVTLRHVVSSQINASLFDDDIQFHYLYIFIQQCAIFFFLACGVDKLPAKMTAQCKRVFTCAKLARQKHSWCSLFTLKKPHVE